MRALGQVAGLTKPSIWICQRCSRGLKNLNVQSATCRTRPATRSRLEESRIKCLRNQSTIARHSKIDQPHARTGVSNDSILKSEWKTRRRLMILIAIIGVVSTFALTETAQHSYVAVKRSLRVAYALVRSVRELVLPTVLSSSTSVI